MHPVTLDGTEAAVHALARALRPLLDGSGGSAVLPLAPGESPLDMRRDLPVEPGTGLIVRTSGSTGAAKGVLLSAAALRASATATHARLGGAGTWLLAMPAHHIAGVQVVIRSLLAGTPLAVLPAGGFRGRRFVEAASDVLAADGPRYTALVPTQLTRLLTEGGDALAAARSFDAVLVGGAATSPTTLAQAKDAGIEVVTTYGMSETAGGCVYDGVPLDGVRVRLEDDVVHLSGPTLAHGYRLDPDNPAFTDGWFHTSDLGRVVDGKLEILGRTDDLINTGGKKVAPTAVERVLTAQAGVAEACVVGLPDPEWGQRVAAAIVANGDVDTASLIAAVRAQLGAHAAPKQVHVIAEIPLRGPGKVDRAAVAQLLASAATSRTRGNNSSANTPP
ncbi:o-succinylbenzoate--CoA ligase [Actinokineospora globicatena]|uniref:O-succinylbenzoic acid--CoA ligase n=1 Tax=Actinokineospora globicatena TaxID=103729 RepID=A0A9W6VE49_9PSEU|nr:o-succinylbenzoate--CoA ligase [Actinokineospora globicatena]GLW95658.1 O-succinylbenzoic acid--CoA ligase [Actinokineospora globicatena]